MISQSWFGPPRRTHHKGDRLEFNLPSRVMTLLRILTLMGGLTFVLGLFFAPQRIWPDLLLASYFLVGIGLAGIFFVALQYVTGAEWSVALRRVPEAMSAVLPLGALLLAVVLLGKPSLYPWLGRRWEGAEAIVAFKRAWLAQPFFLVRSAIYLLLWMTLAYAIVRTSRRQDQSGELALTQRNIRLSAIFIVVFGLTFWLASYDWVMSLEPEWYSTIFGIYSFAGLFSGGLAAIILLVVCLRRMGALEHSVTENHLFDLGRLLSAFSTFWAYIWFSQYMLIWYANFPEETSHFIQRLERPWAPLFVLNLLLNWAIPFLVLMPRASKKNTRVLLGISIVVLAGRWLDLYLMILPPFAGPKPLLGVWEAGILLGTVGFCGLVFFGALRQAPLIPVGDPYLKESLHHHA